MKTKTNQEILDAFNLRPQSMPHSENVKFLKWVLENKDEQARQEKIELVESLPSYHVNGDSNGGFIYPYPSVKKWKNEKLKQLKS